MVPTPPSYSTTASRCRSSRRPAAGHPRRVRRRARRRGHGRHRPAGHGTAGGRPGPGDPRGITRNDPRGMTRNTDAMAERPLSSRGTAVVTGASAGIGAATARSLRSAGFDVVIGARRMDRLNEVADEIEARALPLDVTDAASVDAFAAAVESCSVLVNNAGGALGLDRIADSSDEHWSEMYQRNVLSILRMTRALLPKLITSGDGRVAN